jgi:hypothetical protein
VQVVRTPSVRNPAFGVSAADDRDKLAKIKGVEASLLSASASSTASASSSPNSPGKASGKGAWCCAIQ